MRTKAWGRLGWVMVGLATWALGEPTARAAELCDGRVCPERFTCETYTSTCAANDPGCEVFTETYCQSPECATDADCPAGRRCSVTTYCGGNVPEPGSGGGSGMPEECVEVTESSCDLAYQVACETSAQCGAGFTCKPLVDCDCSDPNAPVPPDCSCELAGVRGCYSPVVPCTAETASSDCASGWSCIENENGVCANIGDFHGGCNAGDPPMVCVPPGFSTAIDGGGELTDDEDQQLDEPAASGGGSSCSMVGTRGSGASALVALFSGLALVGRRRRT